MNIYDILNRARSLKEEYRLDSVTPERLGALHEDTLKYINEYQLLASSPAIHKTYASISAMQSSSSPESDLTGKPLKAGQLVVIVPADPSDSTAGDVYRYDGPSGNTSKWTFIAKIGAVPADAELSATSTNPPQNQAVTAKLTELEDIVGGIEQYSSKKEVTKNITSQVIVGAFNGYVTIDGVVTSYPQDLSWKITQPYYIKAGVTISFYAGGSGASFLSKTNKTSISFGDTLTPIITSGNANHEYTFSQDTLIVISGTNIDDIIIKAEENDWNIAKEDELNRLEVKMSNAEKSVSELNSVVDSIKEKMPVDGGENIYDCVIASRGQGKYIIPSTGNTADYVSYSITEPIHLNVGDTIKVSGLVVSQAASLAEFTDNYSHFNVLKTIGNFSFTADKEMYVVISGQTSTLKKYTISRPFAVVEAASKKSVEDLNDDIIGITSRVEALETKTGIRIFSPYSGFDFSKTINAMSHEHCYTKEQIESSYERGIRVIACSHYQPAVPRYPLKQHSYQYQDYNSVSDKTIVTRTYSGSIPEINIDGTKIDTDDIIQIANAEHPLIKNFPGHFNLLGFLWSEPGAWLGNNNAGGTLTPTEYGEWKEANRLVTEEVLNTELSKESNWQFGKRYAFGTINHNNVLSVVKSVLDTFPSYFKAMELFNQGYGVHWNKTFRDTYDNILKQGYRIWGTAVADWQNDWATWGYIDAVDKAEWTEKYNSLPESEKSKYSSAQDYYTQIGRYKFDRGMNVILIPTYFDSLSTEGKAKEVLKSYIGGRYYMSGTGAHTTNVSVNGSVISFFVSEYTNIKVITANGITEFSDTDLVQYVPKQDDKFVRFEAEWSDGDFIYTNPCWIE